jgi:hypothetical protein
MTQNGEPCNNLWLAMMSACGNDEAILAHLLLDEVGTLETNDNI